ncbi:MAG: hypothetical protein R3F29_03085 [Planctomycetota bacterium]
MGTLRNRPPAWLAAAAATLLASTLAAQQVRYYVAVDGADASVTARVRAAVLAVEPDLKIETIDAPWLLRVTAPAVVDWSKALPTAMQEANAHFRVLRADTPELNFDALPRPTDERDAELAERRHNHWRAMARTPGLERTELRLLLRCRELLRVEGRRKDPRFEGIVRFDTALDKLWRDRLGTATHDALRANIEQEGDVIAALTTWSTRDDIQSASRMASGFGDKFGIELLTKERLADYELASTLAWREITAQLTAIADACALADGADEQAPEAMRLATECRILAREAELLGHSHWETDAIAAANAAKVTAGKAKRAR